ncbi:hypothetical protein [Devosia enhydra]|nr:hypothetical protein [Devosia enhydra]
MQLVNEGVAGGIGSPVDLVATIMNAGIGGINSLTGAGLPTISEPIGGAASIERLLNGLGISTLPEGQQAEGLAENALLGVGGAAGALLPFVGGARVAQGIGQLSQGAGGAAKTFGDAIVAPFIQAPVRAIGSELAAGAGAAVGADAAENVAPDNPVAPMIGALAGGLAAGAGPFAVAEAAKRVPVVSAATRFVQSEIAPFTHAGAMERARSRMGDLVEDPAAAVAGLNAPTISELSPAVATGERRLMSLEQVVRDTDPTVDLIMRNDEAESGRVLREALREPAAGGSAGTARDYMGSALDQNIEGVGQALDAALGRPLGVDRTSTALREASAPTRSSAYDAAYAEPIDYSAQPGRDLEMLIGRVEQAAPGTIALANRMMAGEGVQSSQIMARISDTGAVTFERMPDTRQIDYITRALNHMARSGDGQGALGGQTDVGRIMGNLSGQIRGALRAANPAYAEALETAATPIRQREALLLGQELLNPAMHRDRAQAMLDEMTGPELAFVRQGVRSSLDEALANVRATLATPDVGTAQAQQALRKLSAPAVREKIGLLLPPEQAGILFQRIDEAASMLDARRSGPALFANARPNEEIRSILNAPNPEAATDQLLAHAARDPSGGAVAGLKSALIDELMTRARSGSFDDTGEPVLSGRALQNALNERQMVGVANRLLSAEERSRLSQIINELSRLETARGRLPNIGAVMEGEPNPVISLMARAVAARMGAHAGKGASGASLLTAHFASQRMRRILENLTLDRAEVLIRQAVTGDRELFEALLTPAHKITPKQESRLARVLTRTAIGATGGAVAADQDDDLRLEEIIMGR